MSSGSGVRHSNSSLAALRSAGSVAAGLLRVTRHASTYCRDWRARSRHDSHVGLGSVPGSKCQHQQIMSIKKKKNIII